MNRNFLKLAVLGHRNPMNHTKVHGDNRNELGVDVADHGNRKAVILTFAVPTGRNERDSRTAAKVTLNGRQARKLYNTLTKFYALRAEAYSKPANEVEYSFDNEEE